MTSGVNENVVCRRLPHPSLLSLRDYKARRVEVAERDIIGRKITIAASTGSLVVVDREASR